MDVHQTFIPFPPPPLYFLSSPLRVRSCSCLVFRPHLIRGLLSPSQTTKQSHLQYKAPKQFSSAAGNAPLSRKNLESLRSRAGRDAASCDPSVRFNEVRLLNFLRCYSRVVVDVESEKGEGRTGRRTRGRRGGDDGENLSKGHLKLGWSIHFKREDRVASRRTTASSYHII